MDSFIFVLVPWFIGSFLAHLPVGKRVTGHLSMRCRRKEKAKSNRITHLLVRCAPLLLTILACSRAAEAYVSRQNRSFLLFLPVILLFSGCFFLSVAWLNADSRNKS